MPIKTHHTKKLEIFNYYDEYFYASFCILPLNMKTQYWSTYFLNFSFIWYLPPLCPINKGKDIKGRKEITRMKLHLLLDKLHLLLITTF